MGESYKNLVANYVNKNGYVRMWDDEAKAPYLWNADSSIFISYEDSESLRYKAAFVKEKGLGGFMFWEISEDNNSELLNTLNSELKK
jgi:chitinase